MSGTASPNHWAMALGHLVVLGEREGVRQEHHDRVGACGPRRLRLRRGGEAALLVDAGDDDAARTDGRDGDLDGALLLVRGDGEVLAGMADGEYADNARLQYAIGDVAGVGFPVGRAKTVCIGRTVLG